MKERTTSVKAKATEVKIKAWKELVKKAFSGEVEALKAIIQIAEDNRAED
jgi:hypothetical protein